MPINKEKSSAYLRHKRSENNLTYSKITELSGVPNATMSAYFNGAVKAPAKETFERLMLAVGGSWAEYDAFAPEEKAPEESIREDDESMNLTPVIQALDASAVRLEAAYNSAIERITKAHNEEIDRMQARYDKTETAHRIEKYVLFVLLVCFATYALFAFTHYDLPDPTSGITSIFQ